MTGHVQIWYMLRDRNRAANDNYFDISYSDDYFFDQQKHCLVDKMTERCEK